MKRIFTLVIFSLLCVTIESLAQTAPTVFAPGTVTTSSLQFTWTGTATTDYIIVRNTSATITDLVDGTTYAVNDVLTNGTVVGITAGNTFTDNSLTANTQYFYKIFDHKAPSGDKYSAGLTGSMKTLATEPTAQPSSLVISSKLANGTGYTVAYTAAAGTPAGYIVLRKSGGSAPASTPVDGTAYTAGNTFGDATVAFVDATPSLTFNETTLTASTQYSYAIYSYNGSGVSINYYLNTPLSGSATTLAAEPTAQPTSLVFSSKLANGTGYTVAYTAAAGAPAGYIVLRKSGGSAPASTPVDGTTYVAGNTFGDATVAFVDGTPSLTFNETTLTASTQYSYAIYSYNGSGVSINYYLTTPLSGSATTLAAEPTAQPTSLVFSSKLANGTGYTVAYTAAAGTPAGYIVLRKSGGSAPASTPVDGTTYVAGNTFGDATVAFVDGTPSLTFNETALTASTQYSYAIYSYNGSGTSINYYLTTPLSGSATTLAAEPTAQPTSLVFSSKLANGTGYTVAYTAATGAPAGYIVLRKSGGSAPASTPVDGTTYVAGNTFGDATVAFVDGTPSLTFNETALTVSTQYSYAIYSYNGAGVSINYYLTTPLSGTTTTVAVAPTLQPTVMTFSSVAATTMQVNYSVAGDGTSRILVAKSGSAVAANPVNGITYSATGNFSTGTDLGGGNIVVGIGAGPYSITNLSSNTTYHFALFEFNGSGGTESYLTTSPLTGNQITTNVPATQATNVLVTLGGTPTTQLSVNWTDGSGAKRITIIKNSTGSFTPVNGTTYVATTALGADNTATDLDPSVGGIAQCVYNGTTTGRPFNATSLASNTQYTVEVYEYNGAAAAEQYLTTTSTGNPASRYTLAVAPTTNSSAMTFSSITATSITVNVTAGGGTGTNRMLVARAGSGNTVSFTPTNGASYTANSDFSAAVDQGSGNKIVGMGSGTSFIVTGLTVNTIYNFSVIEFNGTQATGAENYKTPGQLGSRNTEPSTQASALAINTFSTTGLTLSWTSGNGDRRVVLIHQDNPVDADPSDLTTYSANANWNNGAPSGTQIGTGNYVVYDNNGTNVAVNNLIPNHVYYFAVYEYNSYSGGSVQNNTTSAAFLTPAATASRTTLATLPANSATSLVFSSVLSTQYTVSWTASTGVPVSDGYIVLRKIGSSPTGVPTNGTTYSVGNTIGDGTVAYVGSAVTFGETGLTPSTDYFYDVISYAGSGQSTNYKGGPLSNDQVSACLDTPPSNVTFSATGASTTTVNWTRGSGNNVLVIGRSGTASAVTPNPATTYTANTTFGSGTALAVGGNDYYVVYQGTGTSVVVTGMNGNTAYNFKVYEYNSTNTCYLLNPATNDVTTAAANTNSTLTAGTGSATIASTVTSQGAETAVFTFTATDLGGDNISTRFTQLVFKPGTGNYPTDWTQIIAGAELYDNATFGGDNGGAAGGHGTAIITANTITIPTISDGNPPDLGSITNSTSRIYTLKIWFKTTLGGSLASSIDNKNLAFSILGSDVTPEAVPGYSSFAPATTTASGGSNDVVTVTATKININQQPSTSPSAFIALPQQPIFEATDVNNNRDLDISNALTVNTTNPTNLVPASAPTNFTSGLADFTGSGFNFHSVGSSTMSVSITTPTLASPNSSVITVTASTNLGSSATSMSTSPLTNGTTGVISGGVATNAVLGFNLQTTGSPLNLTDLVFNSSVSTTGLVSNFQLYSNSSDSFTGATQVATSSSLTFSGMSIGLTGSPTYFFLVCDVAAYFPSAGPTIQFSLPAGNFTVSTGGKTGSTQTGTNYTLQDLTPPTVQSIAVVSPPVTNPWSTTNGTSASTVTFRVTFNEPVSGIQYSGGNKNFTGQTSGAVSFSNILGGAGSTGTNNYVDVTVSSVSGQGLLRIDLNNDTDNIIDASGNPLGGFGFGNGIFFTSFTGNQFYSIVLPAPSNPVAGFSINSEDDIELQTKTTSDLLGPQLPTHYLFMVRESQGSTPFPTITNGILIPDNQHDLTYPPDGTYGDYASGDGLFTYNVPYSASVFNYTWLFKAGMLYDFVVYPYTRSANYSDDNIAYGTPTFISNHLIGPVATNSVLNSSPNPALIASTYNSGGNMKQVFTFGVTDGMGTTTGDEFAPTKFSSLNINKDVIDNAGSWVGIIAGAELFDVSSPTTFVAASSILAGQIQFTGIPASAPSDLGYIAPSNQWTGFVGTKTYGLRIYLNNGAGALTDLKTLAFTVTDASFTYNNGLGIALDHQQSSKLQVGTATSGAQTVAVTATKMLFTTNLPDKVGVNHIFATPPVVEARDANDNLDLDFTGATISASNGITFSNQPTWSLAKLTFSTFTFNDPGLTQITVSKGGVTSAVSSSPTGPGGQTDVKISAYTSVNQVTGVGIPSATVPSITTFSPSVAPSVGEQNASALANISFIVKDDDTVPAAEDDKLPTRISTITIHQNANNGTATGGATFDDWTNSIQGADLSVGGVSLGITPTISSNSIVFSGIANSVAASLGYISDDGSRTYVLKIWLKNPVSATLRDIFDGEDFVFQITNAADFGLTSASGNYSSTLTTVSTFDSGDGKNVVDVAATELDFIIPATATQTPATTQSYDANIDFDSGTGGVQAGVIKSRDLNQNLDRGYAAAVTITGGHPSLPDGRTYPINNGTGQSFATGQLTLNSNIQVSSTGNGFSGDQTYLIATSGALTGNSGTFTINYSGLSDVIRKTGFSHPTNIDYATTNNQVSDITGSTGTTIETFTVRDGAGSPDSDGSNTTLDQITFTLQNSIYLKRIALYNNSGLEVAELPVSGTTVAFTGLASAVNKIVANDDNNADFTVKVSFLSSNILDNAVININISSVAAGGVSSGITPGVTTTMPALAATENAIEVIATHIDFTTMPATASVFVSFPVVAQARDNYFNLDVDYNGAVSFTTNGNSSNFTVANLPSGSFSGGVLNYPVDDPLTLATDEGFQFTSGNNATTKLTINGGAASTPGSTNAGAIIAGTSPAPADILVQTSFESWLYFDPTFAYTPQIDFVIHQEASLNTSSQALALLVLSDGGAPASIFNATTNPQPGIKNQTTHKDTDGAFTQISSLSVSLTNVARIRSIAIFDNAGNKIDEQTGPLTSPLTFNNLNTFPNLKAPDDGVTKFYIRASFNQTVTDQDQIQLAITNVTYFAGSNFPAATIGGISGGDIYPTSLGVVGDPNYLNVLATSLDFLTQPSSYAGVNEPIGTDPTTTQPYSYGSGTPAYFSSMPSTTAGIVTLRDKFGNIDVDFSISGGSVTDFAGQTINLAPSTNLVSGVVDLNGMVYTAPGNGTIKLILDRLGSGTITTSGSTVTGVGTNFTGELNVGSVIVDASSGNTIGTVQSITSSTSLTLTSSAAIALLSANYLVEIRSFSPTINTTGTITVSFGSTSVTGTGTLFNTDLLVGSIINDANGNFVGTIQSIASNTSLTLTSGADIAVSGAAYNANSVPCKRVNVIDVLVTQDQSGIVPYSGNPPTASLKGGQQLQNIFGLKFTPYYTSITGRGTITVSAGSTAVTGVGTNFTSELNVGSVIRDPLGNQIGSVLSIASATSLTLTSGALTALSASSYGFDQNPEPKVKGFTIGFKDTNGQDLAYETNGTYIFKNFNVFINGVSNNISSVGGTFAKASSTGTVGIYDQIVVTLPTPQSLNSGPISFFLTADVDASTNTGTPTIIPYFKDEGYGYASDANSVVSVGTSSGSFNGTEYSFASTKPPVLKADIKQYPGTLTSPFAGQPNVNPAISQILLEFDTPVGSLDGGGDLNAELWDRASNSKVATLVLNNSQTKATVISGAVTPVYGSLLFDIRDPLNSANPLAAPLVNDAVYFVKIIQGSYDPNTKVGHGISDYGLNFYGGISDNSTLYFKISSANAPNLLAVKSTFNTPEVGTLTTIFDQFGTAYFLVVPNLSTAPTASQVLAPSTYLAAPVAASGSFAITSVGSNPITSASVYQTVTFSASFIAGQKYDVYVFAKNDAQPTPVPAAGIYGTTLAANSGGPTLTISGITSSSSTTPNNVAGNKLLYTLCPNSYVTITKPMVVSEGMIGATPINFTSSSDQDFNVLLPTGYEFDVAVPPTIQLIGGNFQKLTSPQISPKIGAGTITTLTSSNVVTGTGTSFVAQLEPGDILFTGAGAIGTVASITDATHVVLVTNATASLTGSLYGYRNHPMWEYDYISNTLLNIRFYNNNGLGETQDYIAISGLSVIGKSGSTQLDVKWFYGNNVFTTAGYSVFNLAQVGIITSASPDFNNTYWSQNQPFPSPDPPTTIPLFTGGPVYAAFQKTVNAIPNNYVDATNPNQIRLLPSSGFAQGDYLASFFSGSGVSGDLLTLGAVTPGAAFNITMDHTDLNGCATTRTEQYVVYDHNSPISKKLGTTLNSSIDATTQLASPAGTKQDIVNPNFPNGLASSIIPINPLGQGELAGYKLLRLSVDSVAGLTQYQPISGSAWRTLIHTLVIDSTNSPTYSWDYKNVLNGTAPLPAGLTNVYDYFKDASTITRNNFWSGGSLGKIQYTGAYQATADNSVYVPFRQDVELWVPAFPLIEVVSPAPYFDVNDTKANNIFSTVQYPNGKPGTATFCEYGGSITLNAYPVVKGGSSVGNFLIYDFESTGTNALSGTGTISTDASTSAISLASIVGSGTTFLTQLSQGAILYDVNGYQIGVVQSIQDNTHLTLYSAATTFNSTNSLFDTKPIIGAGYKYLKPLAYPATNTPFVDNANGTMTLNPLLISNSYNDIMVTYTYKDNNSPAYGIGKLVIRITPNPVAQFTLISSIATTGATGSSAFNAFCAGNDINFDAGRAETSMQQPNASGVSYQNYIRDYTWDFGDPNSGANNTASNVTVPFLSKSAADAALATLATHKYAIPSTYPISLSLNSNWGCASRQINANSLVKEVGDVYASGWQGTITIGEIPKVDFSFVGNCTGDPVTFTDNSKIAGTTGGSISLGQPAKFDWNFGDAGTYTGYNTSPSTSTVATFQYFSFGTAPDGRNGVTHQYAAAKFYDVVLTTTSDLGCQNSDTVSLAQLQLQSLTGNSAYQEYFTNDGGWLALNLSGNTPVPGSGTNTYSGLTTSWAYDNSIGKWRTTVPDVSGNLVSGTGGYKTGEKSALYTACLDLSSIPRPVISFDGKIDLGNGEGIVIQYSTDNKNILDATKTWSVLGTTPNASPPADPGLDWYNWSGLASNPGTGATYPNSNNPTGFGWNHEINIPNTTGFDNTLPSFSGYMHPKHSLDNQLGNSRVIFRFALSTLNGVQTGFTIDSVRVGSRTRTVLFENFTTTNAGLPSSSQLNTDIRVDADSIAHFVSRNINSTQLVNVNYHVGFLGQDPFNLTNPSDPSSRVLYYGVKGVPYAFFDGSHDPYSLGGGSDLFTAWGKGTYDLLTLKLAKADFIGATPATPITVVTPINANGSFTADINVIPSFDLPSTTTLQILLLEDTIDVSKIDATKVTTGEKHFEYVPRQMIPDAVGTKYPATTFKQNTQVHLGPNGSVNPVDKFIWTAAKPFDANKYTIVVFLQDELTKEVYQADLFRNINPPTSVVTAIEPTAENIHVYPNPADGELTIELPSAAKEGVSIRMANQLGQFTEFGSFAEGEQKKTIGTGGLTEGVYILQLGSSNNAVRTKVIVLHK